MVDGETRKETNDGHFECEKLIKKLDKIKKVVIRKDQTVIQKHNTKFFIPLAN